MCMGVESQLLYQVGIVSAGCVGFEDFEGQGVKGKAVLL